MQNRREFIGTLGAASIAAVGLTGQPRMIMLICAQALCVGTTALCARRKGANDPAAANFVLQSDAPVWQVPSNVYGSIRVGIAELQERVRPCGPGGRYLFDQLAEYNASPAADWNMGESWSLGDSPSVAAVLNPRCGKVSLQKVREVREDTSYGIGIPGVREILVYRDMDSRYLLEDFFAKLRFSAQE